MQLYADEDQGMAAELQLEHNHKSLAALSVDALIDHILTRYHEIHRHELPQLIELAKKVERVHHDVAHAPLGLAEALRQIAIELDAHMKKEEFVLFPAMRNGLQEGISNPIAMMRHEHDVHDQSIRRIEELTGGFAVPEGACGSWQRLYAGLTKLCSDLREHIHAENDILFPRFELAAKGRCICAHG